MSKTPSTYAWEQKIGKDKAVSRQPYFLSL